MWGQILFHFSTKEDKQICNIRQAIISAVMKIEGMQLIENDWRAILWPSDADLGPQDLLLRFQYSNIHTHGLQRSCGGKGTARPLSQEESASERLGHSLKGGAPRPLP